MKQIIVHKGRTNVVSVSLGYDISDETFTSQIRESPNASSDLIATWAVSFETDGKDGELLLTLDDAATQEITKLVGYMDIKRVTAGEPLTVFDEPLQVLFKDTVTV